MGQICASNVVARKSAFHFQQVDRIKDTKVLYRNVDSRYLRTFIFPFRWPVTMDRQHTVWDVAVTLTVCATVARRIDRSVDEVLPASTTTSSVIRYCDGTLWWGGYKAVSACAGWGTITYCYVVWNQKNEFRCFIYMKTTTKRLFWNCHICAVISLAVF
jgi:hypothetical protein